MIRSAVQLKAFQVVAADGRIGSIDDVFFDDERWAIRYMGIDRGLWVAGWRALISPLSISRTEWAARQLLLSITVDQVKRSPGVDTHKPVSRRQEIEYFDYYGYPYYWAHSDLWGAYANPMLPTMAQIARQRATSAAAEREADRRDTHLRSTTEVSGYDIRAVDGGLGLVEDILFDECSWAIRYVVVDTGSWWFGRHVLVSPEWIKDIWWPERTMWVNVARQRLKSAPRYDGAPQHIDRQWEVAYYQHLQQPGYWSSGDDLTAPPAV